MIKDAAPKHPDSSKWYWLEWDSTELNGAAISTSAWNLPAGITQDAVAVSGLMVGIRLSGGTLNQDYDVQNNITTSNGENLRERIRIYIREEGH